MTHRSALIALRGLRRQPGGDQGRWRLHRAPCRFYRKPTYGYDWLPHPTFDGRTPIEILLVDDHGIFREGAALLLKSMDSTVGIVHARTAHEALEQAAGTRFDLVLLDLGLPDKPGLKALTDLKQAHPDLPIVVLSGQESRETVLDAIKAGAMGFIPKSSEDPKLLWHALRMALAGAVTVPASLTDGTLKITTPNSQRVEDLDLTPRQIDVLRLLVQGLPNKVIARRMNIAETTTRGYVSDLLAAFRVTNRTQLVLEVARRGIKIAGEAGGPAGLPGPEPKP
jgi:DNA-binding NarL/FixJ family response regulator